MITISEKKRVLTYTMSYREHLHVTNSTRQSKHETGCYIRVGDSMVSYFSIIKILWPHLKEGVWTKAAHSSPQAYVQVCTQEPSGLFSPELGQQEPSRGSWLCLGSPGQRWWERDGHSLWGHGGVLPVQHAVDSFTSAAQAAQEGLQLDQAADTT